MKPDLLFTYAKWFGEARQALAGISGRPWFISWTWNKIGNVRLSDSTGDEIFEFKIRDETPAEEVRLLILKCIEEVLAESIFRVEEKCQRKKSEREKKAQ